jgi:hypothetical protein
MDELIQFGSSFYFWLMAALVFGRGMDFLSTWIATPRLILEANPIARRLGWRWGIVLNVLICFGFAFWPLPAIVIATTSFMVAARNFQNAWLMRCLGEEQYRDWIVQRLGETNLGLYIFCVAAQSVLIASIGLALMYFSALHLIPFGIGMGVLTYATAVIVYTLFSLWRIRRVVG